MLTVITGGSGSGKSELAEQTAMKSGWPRFYIATMQPWGEEARQRIVRHRKMRAHKSFITIEQQADLKSVQVPSGCSILVECLSNLCANEIFGLKGAHEKTEQSILQGVFYLQRQAENLVIVTNEIFSGGLTYSDETLQYIKTLACINEQVMKKADQVIECVYGLPVIVKGAKR